MAKLVALTPRSHDPSTLPPSSHHQGKPEGFIVRRIRTDATVGKLKAACWATALIGTAGFLLWAFTGQRSRNYQ